MLYFVLVLVVTGAGSVSLWVDNKWPAIRPGLTYKLGAHIAVTYLLTYVKTAHFTILLAMLIYMLLVSIWFLRALLDLVNKMNGGGGIKSRV